MIMKKDTKGTWKKMASAMVWGICLSFIGMLLTVLIVLISEGPVALWQFLSSTIFWKSCCGVMIWLFLWIWFVDHTRYLYRFGLIEHFLFKVVGIGSVVFGSDGKAVEVTKEHQWFWSWEWKKSPYSLAQIMKPPERKESFGLCYKKTLGAKEYFYWGYNLTVEAPSKDLEALNRLKEAIGERFAESYFSQWRCTVCRILKDLPGEALGDLDVLADPANPSKQEQFKEQLRLLLVPRLEAMGLKFVEDAIVFDEDSCQSCDDFVGHCGHCGCC